MKEIVNILSELDILSARKKGRLIAKNIGFNKVEQAQIVIVINELAKNIFLYACDGIIKIKKIEDENGIGIAIIAEDHGPGILNYKSILEEKKVYSDLGTGLIGVKMIVDSMEVKSKVGEGTFIKVVKYLRMWAND